MRFPHAAVAIAIALSASSLDAQQQRPARAMDHATMARGSELRDEMRRLWNDHVLYTRLYIVSATQKLGDKDATAKRLMRNQEEIGDAIKPYYGDAAGEKLETLLKEHITIATEIVDAAMAGDNPKKDAGAKRWGTNAEAIATMLSGANPNWPKADLAKMLNQHLEYTTEEVTAQLKEDWDKSIESYDRISKQATEMADAISSGIAKQFPSKVK